MASKRGTRPPESETAAEGPEERPAEASTAETAASESVPVVSDPVTTATAAPAETTEPTMDAPAVETPSAAEAANVAPEVEPATEAVPEPVAAEVPPPGAPVPAPAAPGAGRFVVTAVIAALLGGGIGVAGSSWLAARYDPSVPLAMRLALLEQRPAADPAEVAASQKAVAALAARLTALEGRLAAVEAAPALKLPADAAAQLSALEQGAKERLAAAKSSLDALAALPADPAVKKALTDLGARVDEALTAVRESTASDIATLKGRLDELFGRPGSAGGLDDAAAALAQEVRKRNEDVAAMLSGLRERVGSLESLRGEVDGLLGRLGTVETDQKAAEKSRSAVSQTVGAVENRMAAVESEADAARKAQADAVLAVALSDLKSAVDSGRPFADELAVVRKAATAPLDLAALDGFAAKGVPSLRALRDDLPRVMRAMQEADETAGSSAGVLDRLWAHATALVRVRPAGEVPGEDLGSRIARVEARMIAGDVAGALEAWTTLPDPVRAAAADWGAALAARVTVDKALDAQTAAVLSKLSQPKP